MTTLNIAVSVAVVMLDDIRTATIKEKRHQLYVDLPFFCVGFLSQPSKPALEVVPASPGITWLTFVILPNNTMVSWSPSTVKWLRATYREEILDW